MDKEQLNNYMEKVRADATSAIKNFLKNLDINPDALNHIYNVEIKLVEDEIIPNYDPVNNIIKYSEYYLEDDIDEINMLGINSNKASKIYNNLVVTIIHEMLHANRALMVEDGVNAWNIDNKFNDNASKSKAASEGHDIVKYEELLFKMIDDKYTDSFKQYVPIKAKKYDDVVTVVAYDKINKSFVEFYKQRFNEKFSGDIHSFLINIGFELNSAAGKLFHKPTTVIYTYPKEDKDAQIADSSDFYHKNISKTNIDDAASQIDYQQDFEEIIVETLSYMIYMDRNKSYIDLNEMASKIISDDSSDLDTKVGAYIISKSGVDLLKWYLLSVYDNTYNDNFEKLFKSDYIELLKNMSILFVGNEYSEEEKRQAKKEVLNIISQNNTLKQ